MPCDTVRAVSIEWGEHTSEPALLAGLREHGATITNLVGDTISFVWEGTVGYGRYDRSTGRMTLRSAPISEAQLKAAYGRAVVKTIAQRAGWATNETGNQIVLRRKSYGS